MTALVSYDPTTWAGWGEFIVGAALSPENKAAAGRLEAGFPADRIDRIDGIIALGGLLADKSIMDGVRLRE